MSQIFATNELAELVKGLRKDAVSSAIGTSSGLNMVQLEAEAKNLYPVAHPVLDLLTRASNEMLGNNVGGLATTYKALTSIGAQYLPGVAEGKRNAYVPIATATVSSNFVTLGTDVAVTFESQSAGRGFNDNVGTARLASLNELLNLEERMAIFGNTGNSGSGNNGFQLGVPVIGAFALASGGSIGIGATVSVYVVALTGWGIYNATATSLSPQVTQSTADGYSVTQSGGTSKRSAASAVLTTDSGHQSVTVTVTPVAGAFGYAVYVDSTDAVTPSPANAKFAGVFTTSVFTVTALPAGGNQAASAISTSNDFSANPGFDFDGIATWIASSQAGSRPAYWKDLLGAGVTPDGAGGIVEIETAIAQQFKSNPQVSPDCILYSSDLVPFVQAAVMKGPSGTGAARINYNSENGTFVGGIVVEEYKCKFSSTGKSKVLPLINVPWLPSNSIILPTLSNPYTAAGLAVPANHRLVMREPYYSITFPYFSRLHSSGVYLEETMETYVPWAGILLTSVGDSVNS